MCRLYGFRANEPTKVECTLVHAQNALLMQSRGDQRGQSNADGWGIATYLNGTPHIEKHETAAFSTLHFSTAAERLYANTVLAHVRRATVSEPALANTHPFTYGPWVFAHNGTLRVFDQLAPELERETPFDYLQIRRGSTDSELMFCWLLGRMAADGVVPTARCADPARLVNTVRVATSELARRSAASGATRPAELNFLLTDGATMIASRWRNSLYWLRREGVHDCEICGIPHLRHDDSVPYHAVVVASEPLTNEAWQEVPDGGIVVVDKDLQSMLVPMEDATSRGHRSTP